MRHPGNDRINDQINDFIANRWADLCEEWLETLDGGDSFLGWLLTEYSAKERYKLLKLYIDSKDGKQFDKWATDRAIEALTSEEEHES